MATVGDYFALMKPRVMSLVVFTALVGLAVAPGTLHPLTGFTALLCIAVGAGAAGALNMWYDADIDAVMTRTARRPVPMGRVQAGEAFAFGLTLAGFAVATLGLLVNWFAAGLLAFTIFFYVAIYTVWLKRSTPQNIVIGGAAGAFPPMIGWAAATGSLSLEPVLLFLIIFFWTPPHFWALALYRTEDYSRAGIPMLPVVKGDISTRWQILIYTLVLVPLGVSPWFFGYTGPVYGTAAVVTGAVMLVLAWQVLRERRPADRASRNLFAFSVLYLFLLFAVLLVERGWGGLIARFAA
ncbi:MAG TPA: heme o synthase [Pseudolabrys sp.]|nr:heme o synthase [Pseudolabrys sp.]